MRKEKEQLSIKDRILPLMGLYDLACFIGLGAITYLLYWEGDVVLRYLAIISGVKFLEIAIKRFLK